MRVKRCTQTLIAAFLSLLSAAWFLDDHAFLIAALALGIFIVGRYLIFFRQVSAGADSVTITRTLEKVLVRQDSLARVLADITITVPERVEVSYSEQIPHGCTQALGAISNGPTGPGSHGFQISYQIIPLIYGNVELPGGLLTISDTFFEIRISLTGKQYVGPILQVQPYQIFRKVRKRSEFGGREVERIRPIRGYGVRSYREYAQGDDIRHIDWKISAKHDTLVVREFSGMEDYTPLIIVDLPDIQQEYSEEKFRAMISAVSIMIEGLCTDKTGVSLLLISGPNIISIIREERYHKHLMAIIREQMHPQIRIRHLYRLKHRSEIRERMRRLQHQSTGSTHAVPDDHISSLMRVSERFLLESGIHDFASQIARMLSSLTVQDVSLYSLCEGDLSHIQEIALQARHLSIRFRILTPFDQNTTLRRDAFKRLRTETIEEIV